MEKESQSRIIGLWQFSKDLVDELSDLKIFQVEHIAVGVDDGDLTIIK
ncbi:MAG: hypothetical protein J6C86_05615 [Bacteroidaceae bacterium]|nr:hypothetical protein [Bacteroidaceae bacterium]